MAVKLLGILNAKKTLRMSLSGHKEAALKCSSVPKGYIAVYVGEEEKMRHVVPVWYLNEAAFQELLSMAQQEFGEDIFIDLTSQLN